MAKNVSKESRGLGISSGSNTNSVLKRRERRRAIRELWEHEIDIPREPHCLTTEKLAFGFDMDFSTRPPTLVKSEWGDNYNIDLFGRLGLQCYNLQKGTNFEYKRWEKFSTSVTGYFNFYITLEAKDPACNNSLFSFQTMVSDVGRSKDIQMTWMTFACRIKCNDYPNDYWDDTAIDEFYKGSMPKWLSDDDLACSDDDNKYYVLQESELRDYNDWLQLLSEIAFFSKSSYRLNAPQLFEIERIIVETNPEAREKLKERNAIFYITCKFIDPTGEACKHNAIIRKTMDGKPGHICLEVAKTDMDVVPL